MDGWMKRNGIRHFFLTSLLNDIHTAARQRPAHGTASPSTARRITSAATCAACNRNGGVKQA